MNGALALSRFDADVSLVAGYTEPRHAVFARVFVPLIVAEGRYLPWSAAASAVGVELVGTTHWDELRLAAEARAVDIGTPQQGTVDASTINALMRVLAQAGSTRMSHFALWEGYAGEIDASIHDQSTGIPQGVGHYLLDGSYRVFTGELGWAETRCAENGYRFPVAVWPDDGSFALASARYQDSYYLSADQQTLSLLQRAGVDALEITRDEPLPSTGD
jgi:hypothetical protein